MFFVLLNVNLLDSVLTRTGQSESDQPHVKQSVVSLSLWNIDVCDPLWFVLHRLCSTYLLFWDHVLLCRVKTKRGDSFYQKSQYGTQSYNMFRGSTTRRTNLRLPQDERVDVTLVELKPETCSWSKAAVRWRYVVLTASWLWTKAASHVLLLLEGRCEKHPYASHERSSVAPPCGRDSQESVTSAAAGLTTS